MMIELFIRFTYETSGEGHPLCTASFYGKDPFDVLTYGED